MVRRGGPQFIPRPDGATPGRPAPWAQLTDVDVSIDAVERALRGRTVVPRSDPESTSRRSAVLVPLYEVEGDTWVVLTRRAPTMRSHSLEISFPGGAVDATDPDAWYTARREAHEEIGLDPALPRRIGELDPFVTVGSRSFVRPMVAALPGSPVLRANEAEVEHLLQVRLTDLLRPEVFREELWPIGDVVRPVTFFDLVGDTIWGATGAMLRQLLAIVTATGDELTR